MKGRRSWLPFLSNSPIPSRTAAPTPTMQASTSTLRGTLQPGAARATRALLGAAPAQGGCAECFARRARARTTSTQATRTLTTGEETNSRDTLPPRRKPFIARLSSDVYAASFPEDIPRWRRRSQSAILQDDSEKRRFVELRGLADTVTPGDVRRLVSSRMDPNYDGGGREDLRNGECAVGLTAIWQSRMTERDHITPLAGWNQSSCYLRCRCSLPVDGW